MCFRQALELMNLSADGVLTAQKANAADTGIPPLSGRVILQEERNILIC